VSNLRGENARLVKEGKGGQKGGGKVGDAPSGSAAAKQMSQLKKRIQELEDELLRADRKTSVGGRKQAGAVASLTREMAEKDTRILELQAELKKAGDMRASTTAMPQTNALHQELMELRAARQLDSVTLDQVDQILTEAGLLEARCHAVAEENEVLKQQADSLMADCERLRQQAVNLQQENVRLRQ